MSYVAPYVDESGYHYPSYNEIVDDLVTQFQQIYGDGIYLGSDSQDYEIISIFALKIFDSFQAVELAYNAHSPLTAIGTALDYVVAINGINRVQGTKSKATVTLTGAAGTVISNGIVSDIEGRLWDLPETVTLDSNGTASAVATCRETGIVTAEAGAITRIMTPTIGWLSVTNASAATTGTVTETDSALRARQVTSVAQPSQTILSGLKGALLALEAVNGCEVFENDTSSTDANGITAHSICAVVDYDSSDTDAKQAIAKTILMYKSCGCNTYGSTTESVTDTDTGIDYSIKFQQMTHVDVDVEIAITRGNGYSEAYEELVTTAIVEYLNSLEPGKSVNMSTLAAVAMNVNDSLINPAFTVSSVEAARHGSAVGTSDVTFSFYEVAHGAATNITITVS